MQRMVNAVYRNKPRNPVHNLVQQDLLFSINTAVLLPLSSVLFSFILSLLFYFSMRIGYWWESQKEIDL
jgi:hypothetical protein